MKREGEAVAAPKRKRSRGRRKSKAERLARAGATDAPPSADLQTLLSGNSSRDWDAAQSLALRLGSLESRTTVVRVILERHQAPKAAAHYAKRLDLTGADVTGIVDSVSTLTPLLTAQFVVELDKHLLDTDERLHRFVWPWLLQTVEKKEERATLKAATNLLLHPVGSETTTSAKTQEKVERGRCLQRALVTQCLKSGKLLHLVPTYARAFASRMNVEDSVTPSTEEESDGEKDWAAEKQRREEVAKRMQKTLRLLWPDARVLIFGSSATGLLFHSEEDGAADVDLCALLPSAAQFRQETASLITEVKEHLELYLLSSSTSELTAVTRARIPIVHYQDPETGVPCDLCVNNIPALWNTQLLRCLLYGNATASSTERSRLQQARMLCKWLRKWRRAKKRAVGGALSSYGLALLAIYYLQRTSVLPVLDCSALVHEDEASLRSLTYDEIETNLASLDKSFVSDTEHSTPLLGWRALRRGFFRFYTCEFDYDHSVVSLRSSEVVSKKSKGWVQQNNPRLSVEDPIETERDLGALCSRRAFGRLRCAFAHACVVLSEKDANEGSSQDSDVEAELLATWAYEEDGHQDAQDAGE